MSASMLERGAQVTTGEPTADDAARLVRQLMGAGTVDRLDLVHGALLAAYRRGQAAEQDDVAQLAQRHAGAFLAAVVERGREQQAHDARPWCPQ